MTWVLGGERGLTRECTRDKIVCENEKNYTEFEGGLHY